VLLPCVSFFAEQGYAASAQLVAMHIDFKEKAHKTQVVFEFDKKIEYQQTTSSISVQFKFLNTTRSDFTLPPVDPSDPFLENRQFPLNENNTTDLSLFLFLRQGAEPRTPFWRYNSANRPQLVIEIGAVPSGEEEKKPQRSEKSADKAVKMSTVEGAHKKSQAKEDDWDFEEQTKFDGSLANSLLVSTLATAPKDSQDTLPDSVASQPEANNLPIMNPLSIFSQTEDVETEPNDEEIIISSVAELKDTIVVGHVDQSSIIAVLGWKGWFVKAQEVWSYAQIPIDLLLATGLIMLWVRLRKSQRQLKELTIHQTDVSSQDFDTILQNANSGISDLPSIDTPVHDDSSPQSQESYATQVSPQFDEIQTEPAASITSVQSGPSPEDMRKALEQISSAVGTLMAQYSTNPAKDPRLAEPNIDEAVVEDDRSVKAVVRKMNAEGTDQAQIAQQLGITREEVALMLSISED